MIKIIDKWRQGIFILLSFLCFAIFFLTSLNINTQIQSYMLFFLVSLIGIPHGFFDFSIGKNIFQRFRKLWLLYFVSIYILITFFYFSIWVYLPGIALISFLLIASYHFGYEEFNYLGKNKHSFINLSIFIKGLIIVFTPVLFHYEQVSQLFSILVGYDLTKFEFTDFQKNTFIALSIFHVLFEKARDIFYKIECLIYLVNFIFLPPLISFILYFCFSHSIKHFLESIYISKNVPDNFSVRNFLALIISCSVIISFISVVFISKYQDISLSISIIKFIFISLACLTLPHMIFNMIPNRK